MFENLDLKSLNERQRLAVTAPMKPALVLAGAGSGKTRVLAFRIAYVIDMGWVSPEHILALTFTNKAAREMQSRVLALLGGKSGQQTADNRLPTTKTPTLSTFHSLGVRILRQHGYLLNLPKTFAIYDKEDQLKVLKDVYVEKELDEKIKPQAVLHFIHTVKNNGVAPEVLAEQYSGYMSQTFLQGYYGYQAALLAQGGVDLDDLLVLPLKLLSSFEEVRSYYRARFRYILVDEYQDTNPVQYALLRQLSPPAAIFVVGDDAQSIYGFRGSDITNILNFEHDFPEAEVFVLDQNYRSTQNILAVSGAVLKHSKEQKPKVLWTENSAGQRVVVREFANETAEANFVVRTIVELASGITNHDSRIMNQAEESPELSFDSELDTEERPFSVLDYMLEQRNAKSKGKSQNYSTVHLPEKHAPLSQFAILYRTHAQSRALEDALLASGVPYKIVGGVRFYDRQEVKDALSYLRVLQNIRDFVALTRTFTAPPKGIGDKTGSLVKALILKNEELETNQLASVEGELEGSRQVGILGNILMFKKLRKEVLTALPGVKSRTSVVSFFDMLLSWLEADTILPLHELLMRIIHESGLVKYFSDGTETGDARVENLVELVSVAKKFSQEGWQDALPKFLEEVALVSDVDQISDEHDVVTLMTLHSAKGLEFDTVFFTGLEEGLLPHSRSMQDEAALAEEVRLAYVGVTRAKQKLYMTYVIMRGLFGESRLAVPSRLLRELPEHSVEWRGRPRFLPNSDSPNSGVTYEPFVE